MNSCGGLPVMETGVVAGAGSRFEGWGKRKAAFRCYRILWQLFGYLWIAGFNIILKPVFL